MAAARRRGSSRRGSRGSRGSASRGLTRRETIQAGLAAIAVSALWVGREPVGDAIGEVAASVGDVLPRGGSGGYAAPTAAPQEAMERRTELGGARLVYEITDQATGFYMEPEFAAQLDSSFRSHWEASGAATPARLTTYGSWLSTADNPNVSWHHSGRAFDVGRVIAADGTVLVSCRYDLWGGSRGAAEARAARAYWKLAATLHRDFEHVLTYLFDSAHHNHMHVDNSVSGASQSSFRRGSHNQVQALQAMCTHVWDRPVEITGRWNSDTRRALEDVLRVTGAADRFGSDDSWRAFLTATARH